MIDPAPRDLDFSGRRLDGLPRVGAPDRPASLSIVASTHDPPHAHPRRAEGGGVVQLGEPVVHLVLVLGEQDLLEPAVSNVYKGMLMPLVRRVDQGHGSVGRDQRVGLEVLQGGFEYARIGLVAPPDMVVVLVHQILDPGSVAEKVQLRAGEYGTPFLPGRACLLLLGILAPQDADLGNLDVDDARVRVFGVVSRLLGHEGIGSRPRRDDLQHARLEEGLLELVEIQGFCRPQVAVVVVQLHHVAQVGTQYVEFVVDDQRVGIDRFLVRPLGRVERGVGEYRLLLGFVRDDTLSVDVQVVFDVDERRVADVVVEDFEDLVEQAFSSRVLQVVCLLHLVLVVLVEHVCVQDQEGKGDEVCLVGRGIHSRVALVVSVREGLQAAIDLLRLLGQLRLHEQLADRHVHGVAVEHEASHVAP